MSHLYSALRKARARVDYARAERARFEKTMDADNDAQQRTWRKLDQDVKQAERDCAWAALAVEDALAGERVLEAYRGRQ